MAENRSQGVGTIFLVAGEPSGDVLGARLMRALKEETGGEVAFAGVGGPLMAAEGLDSLFPMSDLSVMGLAEVLPRIPRLLRRLAQTAAAARRLSPDAVVTIDAPDFSFRLAKKLKGAAFPLIHYVAPTVWAWRPGRARKIARLLDHLLALLPFEPPYFTREGLACDFVGHPVIESGADRGDGAAFRRAHGIDPEAPLVCVLPGSRRGETSRLLPVFSETLRQLAAANPSLQVVVPAAQSVAGDVAAAATNWPVPALVVLGESERYAAFAAADVALAASGTVALELALAETPAVIAYRVSPLTAWIGRRLIRVPFANLVNIVLDREVVPEFLQERCRPDLLALALRDLLSDPDARQRQTDESRQAIAQLGGEGPPPSRRAARAVLSVISADK